MEDYTQVFAWGLDHKGQLGLGSKTGGKSYCSPRFCSFNILIKEISCGEDHTGFISTSGHLYCMGSNSDGKLGIGDKSVSFSSSPCLVESLANYKLTKLSCGWSHTAVITSENLLFTWGSGQYGALGTGDYENQWKPVEVRSKVSQVSCGSRHTGIIIEDSLYMCGSGEAGQLGTGRRQRECVLTFIETQASVASIACGEFHSGFITKEGSVYTTGGNSFGQLGIGTKKSMTIPTQVNISGAKKLVCGNHSVCITADGVYVWGNSIFGEYLVPKKIKFSKYPIIEIALGSSFGVAVDCRYNLFAWGSNSNGELGIGNYQSRSNPVCITALKGKKITKIGAGGSFCMCLGENNQETEEPTCDQDLSSTFTKEISSENTMESNINTLLQEERKKNFLLAQEIDELHRTQLELKESLQLKLQESNNQYHQISCEVFKLKNSSNDSYQTIQSLKSENNSLKEEISRLKKLVDLNTQNIKNEVLVSKIKEIHYIEVQEVQAQLEKEKVLKKQIERDLEVACNHRHRLEAALAEVHDHMEEQNVYTQQNLLMDIKQITAEKDRVNELLEESMKTNLELQEDIEIMHRENKYHSENTRNLQNNQEKLEKQIKDLENSLDALNTQLKQQDFTIKSLKEENYSLKDIISDLELKAKDLLITREKELSSMAKEFKERTMNILTPKIPPLKSIMPKVTLIENSPNKDQVLINKDRLKSSVPTENKEPESPLTNTRVYSPDQRSPENTGEASARPGAFTFRKSITPSKEDIKSKIAALMQNRSRIEKKLQLLQTEQATL
jgi:X-linked retinitis pigmentosa GTPase regulator